MPKQRKCDLYAYLKTEFGFGNLEQAKKFMRKWSQELDETLPVEGYEMMSSRSLAAHCSAILEGKEVDDSGSGWCTDYLNTKYGSVLYYAAWGEL